jgi:hypothetical protein
MWNDESQKWQEVYLSKEGTLRFEDLKNQHAILKKSYFCVKDTELTVYLRTNSPAVTIKNNGKTITRVLDNSTAKIEDKIIQIPLEKRWNELQFFIENREGTTFSLLPLQNELILNEATEIRESQHLAVNKPVQYITEYSPRYHGFGEALTDGLRGSTSHTSQLWQGWNAENMEVVIDLESKTKIKGVQLGLLKNHGSWIFLPKKVEVFISKNGKKSKRMKSKSFDIPTESEPTKTMDLVLDFAKEKKARYVKIIAEKLPKIPDWHAGAGGDGSWIFVDEILVN